MLQRLIILCALVSFLVGCAGVFGDREDDEAPQSVATEELAKEETPTPPQEAEKEEPAKEEPAEDVPSPPPVEVATDLGNLLIIGEAEYVYLGAEQVRLAARIDTGAETSSLGAKEITPYERDGKKWVRFKVKDPRSGKEATLERRQRRTVKIKRHNAESEKRYVVSIPVKLGSIDRETDFTLTDRSNFEFTVLIGRNFLKGKAVVDVNRKYSITPLAGK